MKAGPLRIFKGNLPYPGLVITRSLGDSVAGKIGVLCEPDVVVRDVSDFGGFVVLASDGVWDAFPSTQEVVDIVAPYYQDWKTRNSSSTRKSSGLSSKEAQEASLALTKTSLEALDKQQLDDNITNIIVFL